MEKKRVADYKERSEGTVLSMLPSQLEKQVTEVLQKVAAPISPQLSEASWLEALKLIDRINRREVELAKEKVELARLSKRLGFKRKIIITGAILFTAVLLVVLIAIMHPAPLPLIYISTLLGALGLRRHFRRKESRE